MARLSIILEGEFSKQNIFLNKYYFSSSIYSALANSELKTLHEGNKFRYFTFSDFFPCDKSISARRVIISSPNEEFINELYNELSSRNAIYLYDEKFEIVEIKKISIKSKINEFITGSPVVVYKDNKSNTYFSLKRGDTLSFFLRRIKDNAVKKYRQFYQEPDFNLDDFIFDVLKFKKEVSVRLEKDQKPFIIIGTMWYSMKKIKIKREYEKFYRFIMEAGIGEKNSLGFGFLNPVN